VIEKANALADTSTFIALEHGRPLRAPLPDALAVSYVTIAELTVGVLQAPTSAERARRSVTLRQARQLEPLPVDRLIAATWAELRTTMREMKRRMPVNDSWIAATAIAHELPVVAQDDDYSDVPGLEVIRL
jgi:predicted nucleic acid-binding protein